MTYTVHVSVATARPPRADAVVRVIVESDSDTEATLLAALIASCHRHVVMPVATEIIHLIA